MKQILYCFFYLIPLVAGSVVAHSLTSPKDVVFVLKARVTDSYNWSEKERKYSLETSQFDLTISSGVESDKIHTVLHKDSITDTSKKDVRYLSVYPPDKVHFETVSSASLKKMVVKAKISDDKEKLYVYFPNKSKSNILSGMLLEAGVDFPVQLNGGTSSDYNCYVANKQLVCKMNYRLTRQL